MNPAKDWNNLTHMEQDLALFFVNVWVRKRGDTPEDWKAITNHLWHYYQVWVNIDNLKANYYLLARKNLFTFIPEGKET